MKTYVSILILCLVASNQIFAGHDEVIPVADLPPALVKTLAERYPTARTTRAKRERKKDHLKYEVDLCVDGRALEVEMTAEGQIKDVDDEGAC